jgi:hypothetical protein
MAPVVARSLEVCKALDSARSAVVSTTNFNLITPCRRIEFDLIVLPLSVCTWASSERLRYCSPVCIVNPILGENQRKK